VSNAALTDWFRQSVFYQNSSPAPTPGMRQIAVVPFNKDYAGDTAYLWLPLIPSPDAGTDGSVELCQDGSPFSLFDYLGGSPDPAGTWTPATIAGDGWFDPAAGQPGAYQYTVSGDQCPESVATVTVAVHALPQFSLGDSLQLCPDDSLLLEPAISSGIFNWQDGSTGSSYTVTSTGMYWLEVTDTFGCQWRDSVIVTAGGAISVDSSVQKCEGDFYVFQGQAFFGDTTVCVTGAGASGCDSTFCLNLSFLPLFTEVEEVKICDNESYEFHGNLYAQPGTYADTVAGGNGCDSIFTLLLDVAPLPTFAVGGDTVLCAGETTVLTVNGNFTSAQWSTGDTGNQVSIEMAGIYSVTVIDAEGCSNEGFFEVHQAAPVELEVQAVPPGCVDEPDGKISIASVTGGFPPYMVFFNGELSLPPYQFSDLAPGTYVISIEDSFGCIYEESVGLPAPEPVWLDAGDDKSIHAGDSVLIQLFTNASDIQSVSWQPDEYLNLIDQLSAYAMPPENLIYTIYLVTVAGCTASDDITITVQPSEQVYVPNAFSPNDDGINDEFVVFPAKNISIVRTLIFSRWGELIFDGPGNKPWDGKFRGKPMTEGVYTYMVEVLLPDGQHSILSGDITILR
jgi:gliding motility-associated-like protein